MSLEENFCKDQQLIRYVSQHLLYPLEEISWNFSHVYHCQENPQIGMVHTYSIALFSPELIHKPHIQFPKLVLCVLGKRAALPVCVLHLSW